jgi:hypothetical protein
MKRPAPHDMICVDCRKTLKDNETLSRHSVGGPFVGAGVRQITRPCPDGPNCTDFDERHTSVFSHHGVAVRKPCDQDIPGLCCVSDPIHIRTFEHPRPFLEAIPLTRCNIRDPENPLSTMTSSSGDFRYYTADLLNNTDFLFSSAASYVVQENGGKPFDPEEFRKISRWFMHHRCVIYCSKEELLFAIRNNGFCSKMYIKEFWDTAENMASSIMENTFLLNAVRIRGGNPEAPEYKNFIVLLVKQLRTEKSDELISKNKAVAELLEDTPRITADEIDRLKIAAEGVRVFLNEEEFGNVNRIAKQIVDDIAGKLVKSAEEMKHKESHRLNFSVSCSMGPIPKCGKECAVIIRESLLGHPDTFMHPVGSLSYVEGVYHNKGNLMDRTPYLGPSKKWDDGSALNEAHVSFNREKISPAFTFWADTMAYEWIARVHATKKIDVSRITLRDIQELWNNSDEDCRSEVQLPQFVHRRFWERIILTRRAKDFVCEDVSGRDLFAIGKDQKHRAVHEVIEGNDPRLVGERVSQIMEREGPSAYRPTGFTFGMNDMNYCDEVPVPVKLPEAAAVYIYFTALSEGAFNMIFSNTRDYYDDSVPRITQTLRFNTARKTIQSISFCAATDDDPIGSLTGRKEASSPSFDKFPLGVDSKTCGGIHFRVGVEYKLRKIIVSLSGMHYSYLLTDAKAPRWYEFDMPPMLGEDALRFVSFSNVQKDIKTTVWNFRLSPTALPEYDYAPLN